MSDELGKIIVRLLGPISVRLGGTTVTPSATKQRQIIAMLALNSGHVVTVPTLVEELWGSTPPRSSATTLQTYILQLRNRLSSAAPHTDPRALLSTRHGGYMLEPRACEVDVDEFSRLARAGRQAAEAEDYQVASEVLGRALALWGGSALADMRLGPLLELDAASLEEARLGVLERRIHADLALRRHTDLVSELSLLSARHPMNENFCGLLMMALYRSGHVGRALEAFQRLRTVLRRELGVDPCPRLQRLQQRVLAGDPALEFGDPSGLYSARPADDGRMNHEASLSHAGGPGRPAGLNRGPIMNGQNRANGMNGQNRGIARTVVPRPVRDR